MEEIKLGIQIGEAILSPEEWEENKAELIAQFPELFPEDEVKKIDANVSRINEKAMQQMSLYKCYHLSKRVSVYGYEVCEQCLKGEEE
jgi:hypothetical protein